MAHPRRWRVLDDLRKHGVEMISNARVRSIGEKAVEYDVDTGETEPIPHSIETESVILAIGLGSNPTIAEELKQAGVPIREIGDVTGVSYLEGAVYDGFHAALEL
jgi:predicted flavoprotein YhiN